MPPRLDRPRKPSEGSVEPSKAPEALPRPRTAEAPPEGSKSRLTKVDLGLFNGRKPVFIGLDQSLTGFGFAAYSTDGTAFLWLHRTESRGVRRLFEIGFFVRNCLQQVTLQCGEPQHIVMEGYGFSRQMGHSLGECGATTKIALIQALGYCNPVAYPTIVVPQHVKKFATSKGNAKKSEMLLAVYKKWGVDLPSEDMADAYVMARMAAGVEHPDHCTLAYEKEVLSKLEKHTEWPDSLERDASIASG